MLQPQQQQQSPQPPQPAIDDVICSEDNMQQRAIPPITSFLQLGTTRASIDESSSSNSMAEWFMPEQQEQTQFHWLNQQQQQPAESESEEHRSVIVSMRSSYEQVSLSVCNDVEYNTQQLIISPPIVCPPADGILYYERPPKTSSAQKLELEAAICTSGCCCCLLYNATCSSIVMFSIRLCTHT